jgi:hypothetical protein
MPETHAIAMQVLDRGAATDDAVGRLRSALDGAAVGDPDDTGIFTVEVPAGSQDAALARVWDAVAAAGADDHVAFAEHPDLPEHWRHRAAGPRA